MNRGDVYWAYFPDPIGRRPGLILTRQAGLSYTSGVKLAPLTTRIRELPTRVFVDTSDGMPMPCCVNLEAIQTLDKSAIGDYITTLGAERMAHVRDAALFALGLDSD